MTASDAYLICADADAWRAWLASHHEDPGGTWLLLAKKGTTEPTRLTYPQALEEALRWGWIDGQIRPVDEAVYVHRFTPRRARSPWSRRNKVTVERLMAEGRMEEPGLREVERARADGRWGAAYAVSDHIDMPADLAEALAAEPRAQAQFDILTKGNRRRILFRVTAAKRAETRRRRIEEFVAMLARGETPLPQKQRLEES